jgi:uroporphyrinogen decarboxylase
MQETMTGRERVTRTLTYRQPDRVPRDLWMLGTIPIQHGAELDALVKKYPMDFVRAPLRWQDKLADEWSAGAGANYATSPGGPRQPSPDFVGRYVDEWGSEWEVLEPGVVGEVIRPHLANWADLRSFSPPYALLENLDISQTDAFYAGTDKFVLCSSMAEPFQRLIFLRGFENLMMDLGYDRPELHDLLAQIHAFNLRNLHSLVDVAADGIMFNDDWGSHTSLLISPRQWRELFKPLYAEYCQIIRDAGKFVFFHSDGYIADILPDLIEIGIDAINSQLFCMDIEELARQHKGQITFWGEIDRQGALVFGSPADVRKDVERVRRALDDGQGGLIAQCEWANDTPHENIEAVYAAWRE